MDEISNTNGISYFHDFSQVERATFEQSLVAVVNSLTGSKKTTTDLTTMKISEDILYASLVFDKLKSEAPQAAKGFLDELSTRFHRRIERSDTQPLAKALHDTMQTAVSENRIGAKKADTIKAESFAIAQLDKRTSALSRTAKKGGIVVFEDKVSSNSQAVTDKNLKQYEKFATKLETPTFLTPEQSRREQKYLQSIVNSMVPGSSNAGTGSSSGSTGTTSTTSTKSETDETDKKVETPTVTDAATGPGDLVYKPDSQKDEFPLLMIPSRYAHRVRLVEVANAKNEVIERIDKFSQGDDGRIYVRLKTKANKLGDDPWMKIHLVDQSSFDVFLQSGTQGLVERF